MTLLVTAEHRLVRTPDGGLWATDGAGYRFWRRYLAAFPEVRVAARVAAASAPPVGAEPVEGPGVRVFALPFYLGPAQFARRWPAVRRALRAAAADDPAVLARVPSVLGSLLTGRLRAAGRPYALEVVGDPADVFAPGAVRHPLRAPLRRWFVGQLRRQCRHAAAVAYVTETALQRRYPPGPAAVTAAYSSIDLPPAAFVAQPRPAAAPPPVPVVVSVGSLAQPYKGVDTELAAVALLAAQGRPVRLVHVGAGRLRGALQERARRLGIADRVTFTGALPAGEAVRARLDSADLFLLASRTEGLPRALIEAMARGLPAVGTRVGGVPELLAAADTVPADDAAALAAAVGTLLDDPVRMAAASARNLSRAHDFAADRLAARRQAYYAAVAAAHRRATHPSPSCLPGTAG